jgi:hydrogenase nickel incorporation protein HypB
MVESALAETDLEALDALIIENVGNLVCPTGFDLGESVRVVIGSVPEGSDKPEKYPFMFERADVVVLNKIDLLGHVPFDKESFWRHVGNVNRSAVRFEISCTTGVGIDPWLEWFSGRLHDLRASRSESA